MSPDRRILEELTGMITQLDNGRIITFKQFIETLRTAEYEGLDVSKYQNEIDAIRIKILLLEIETALRNFTTGNYTLRQISKLLSLAKQNNIVLTPQFLKENLGINNKTTDIQAYKIYADLLSNTQIISEITTLILNIVSGKNQQFSLLICVIMEAKNRGLQIEKYENQLPEIEQQYTMHALEKCLTLLDKLEYGINIMDGNLYELKDNKMGELSDIARKMQQLITTAEKYKINVSYYKIVLMKKYKLLHLYYISNAIKAMNNGQIWFYKTIETIISNAKLIGVDVSEFEKQLPTYKLKIAFMNIERVIEGVRTGKVTSITVIEKHLRAGEKAGLDVSPYRAQLSIYQASIIQ